MLRLPARLVRPQGPRVCDPHEAPLYLASSVNVRRKRRSSYSLLPAWVSPRRVAALLAAVVVGGAGIYGVRLVLGLSHAFHENPLAAIKDLVDHGNSQVASKFASGQRINIALYGYGGAGHDGAYLTDSIMVVSIQPRGAGQKPQIAEISIPRDWYVPIDLGNGKTQFGRINEAYESGQSGFPFKSDVYTGDQGGGHLANATLERMLGIHIDHFIGVDFTAFKDAVDAVGGVDINVQHTFTDNRYPEGECGGEHPDCKVTTIHFDAGMQHMDGARALIFARSRESTDPQEGTNFARNKRQQLVLTAVKQKVLSIGGLRNLPDLLNSLGDHVIHDFALDDAISLYDYIKDVDPASIAHVSIDDTNFIYECGYPTNCDSAIEYPYDRTFESIHHFVQNVFVDPAVVAQKAPITVVDGSGRGLGAQTRWSQLLKEIDLQGSDGGVGAFSRTTHVIDNSGGRDAATAQWLAKFFNVQVESGTATAGTATTSGGVTLILGQDEEQYFRGNGQPGLYGYNGGGGSSYATQAPTSYVAPRRTASPTQAAAPPPPTQSAPSPTPICLVACKPHH